MSHYKPYPAYRDSGAEWIGQVPEHWRVSAVKREFHTQLGKMLQPEQKSPSDIEVPYHKAVSVQWENVANIPPETMWASPSELEQFRVLKGDLLICEGGDVGRAAIFDGDDSDPVIIQNSIHRVRAKNSDSNELLLRVMQTVKRSGWFDVLCSKATIVHFTSEKLGDLAFPVAPSEEQKAIVDSVKRETTRIDALIAKKTRFIELLKEKRHALIDHAVTKGLNSEAPIRNSGVEWLGEIPAHWLVAQLGKISIARCDGPFGSGLKSEHYQADGVRVVRLQNIGWASFKDGNEAFISHQHWQDVLGCGHEVLPNDILIGGLGDEKNPLGRACVAPANLGPAMVKADCYRFRLDTSRANPDFIALALSATARAECGYLATGATRDRLNLGLASARVVPLPPLNEQAEIVAALNRDTARLDLLTEKTQRSIDLLKERRAAFITAAVTGQIDLREAA